MSAALDRTEFHAERRLGIGGSDAPAIVGESPFKGPYEVWAEKVGLLPPDDREEEHLELGLVLEPYVARRYQRETGRTVRVGADVAPRGFLVHPTQKHRICHIDALIEDQLRGPGIMQIKATGWERDEWADGGVPDHVRIQHHHEMDVATVRWGVIAVFFGAPVHHVKFHEIELQPDLSEVVADAVDNFWERNVLQQVAPDPTALDLRVVQRLFPGVREAHVQLPEEAIEWDRRYLAAAEAERRAKEEKNAAKALLLQAIGDAALGRLPNRLGSWRRKLVERKGYVVEPTSYVDARRLVK